MVEWCIQCGVVVAVVNNGDSGEDCADDNVVKTVVVTVVKTVVMIVWCRTVMKVAMPVVTVVKTGAGTVWYDCDRSGDSGPLS